jgi:heat-inducible transcriptional repressor
VKISERSQNILEAVVLEYIRSAFPVGSQTLTKNFNFKLSPATIRNIMADLEETGYLFQPHTSAGRVPTEKGFRFYVDRLVEEVLGTEEEFDPSKFQRSWPGKWEDAKGLFEETSRLLSMESHYTGMVLAPRLSQTIFKQVEFIRLRKNHLLAIFVSQDGFLHQRFLEVDEDYTQKELSRIAAYLNNEFSGMTLSQVKKKILALMKAERDMYDQLIQKALELGRKALSMAQEGELYLGGTTNILDLPEFADAEKMKGLFKAFEEKATIVELLDTCLSTERVQVLIGSDNAFLAIQDCSLVIANYKRRDQTLGSLGVIGPIRMDYSRVIPLVSHIAKLLSQVLEELEEGGS